MKDPTTDHTLSCRCLERANRMTMREVTSHPPTTTSHPSKRYDVSDWKQNQKTGYASTVQVFRRFHSAMTHWISVRLEVGRFKSTAGTSQRNSIQAILGEHSYCSHPNAYMLVLIQALALVEGERQIYVLFKVFLWLLFSETLVCQTNN